LPPVTTIEDALADGAPLLFDEPVGGAPTRVGEAAVSLKEPRPNVLYEFGYRNGDAEAVLAASDHVFEDRFVFSRINHFHLEPHVNIAQATRDGIELWSCNQDPFVLRNDIARIFGRPANAVRIHSSFVGGGFGGKSFCKMEPLVVLLAIKAGRPVRLCLSMDEALLTLTKHAAILVLKTGVTADGRLTARHSEIFLDAGAYSDASVTTTIKTGYRIGGPYRWEALESHAYAVRTTMVPAGSFRGFGGTQASFAGESQIDMIARRLGIDPVDFRRKNLLTREEPFQPGDSAIDSDLPSVLDEVAARIGYNKRPAPPPRPKRRGWGLAIGLKDGGGTGNHSLALVKVLTTGHAIVHAATVEIGQGATTALCRIAAETLGLPLDWVRYGDIDTEHTPLNNGTHVSCATAVTGLAIERAAQDARRQIMEFAAAQLDCAPDELVLENWTVRRGNYFHPIDKLIGDYFGGAGTEFLGRGSVKIEYDPKAPIASPAMFWIPCWVGAEVEVDTETGKVEVHGLSPPRIPAPASTRWRAAARSRARYCRPTAKASSRNCATTARIRRMRRRFPTVCRWQVICRDISRDLSSSMAAPARLAPRGSAKPACSASPQRSPTRSTTRSACASPKSRSRQNACWPRSRPKDDHYRQFANVQFSGDAPGQRAVLGSVARLVARSRAR
jgi:CO/xanthine dehydrogenase Mo-binding subunit